MPRSAYLHTHRENIEQVFATLAYFDGVNLAARCTMPGLFSTALMDDVCPPSTVFAAYNHYAGAKDIKVWAYNGHEGGGDEQTIAKMHFLNQHLAFASARRDALFGVQLVDSLG